MSKKEWQKVDVITSLDAREPIEYGLMEAGALGTETIESDGEVQITGYFENAVDEHELRQALCDALRIYNRASNDRFEIEISAIPDRDWLSEWKKNWQPVEVGRFIVAPPWIESEPRAVATGSSHPLAPLDPIATAPGSDKSLIRINPGMAFGTGTHETTRLCLKAIEKYFRGGSFLDVGTGTGILAIAAAKMFPEARIEACDTDAEVIEIGKANAHLNSVRDRIEFHVGSVDEQTQSADLVCANLTAPVIVELLPLLLGATCGRLVMSGILDAQIDLVTSRLRDLGAAEFEVDHEGEWIAIFV